MKKLAILVMAMVLVVGMSLGALAQLDNPWVNDGDRVNVNLQVTEWGEVWSNIGTGQARDWENYDDPIVLKVDNAGGIINENSKAEDTLNHYANTDYEVSVTMNGHIPEWTRFHVILNPADSYETVTEMQSDNSADKIITWDRRAGGGDNYVGNQPGDTISLLTGTSSIHSNSDEVHYVMDAIHGLPSQTSAGQDITVIYTIAANAN